MNELFYFAFVDLMVRVEYDKSANALRYASHRRITSDERIIVEQYLLARIAVKTDYYKKQPSLFMYLGRERRLVKQFNRFHGNTTRKDGLENEKEVVASVEGLINQSMQNYYFEKIGDAILAMRQESRNGASPARSAPLRRKMEELVKAYNSYSEQKISVAEIIPTELQPQFGAVTASVHETAIMH